MMEQSGEPLLLVFPCSLPHTTQSLGHPFPALCQACVGFHDVLLGQGPFLHHLRRQDFPGLVRRLRRYYAPVRLLAGVPARTALLASRADPAASQAPGCRRGLSVLARAVSRRAYGSWTTPGLAETRDVVPVSVAFPLHALGRRPVFVFRSSIPRPSMPLSTLHPAPHCSQRKTRGQDGSLLLSCGALSSPTARRFIPTLAHAYAWRLCGQRAIVGGG